MSCQSSFTCAACDVRVWRFDPADEQRYAESWWRVVPDERVVCTVWWERDWRKPAGRGKRDLRTASRR